MPTLFSPIPATDRHISRFKARRLGGRRQEWPTNIDVANLGASITIWHSALCIETRLKAWPRYKKLSLHGQNNMRPRIQLLRKLCRRRARCRKIDVTSSLRVHLSPSPSTLPKQCRKSSSLVSWLEVLLSKGMVKDQNMASLVFNPH